MCQMTVNAIGMVVATTSSNNTARTVQALLAAHSDMALRILKVLPLPSSREHFFAGRSTFEPASQKK